MCKICRLCLLLVISFRICQRLLTIRNGRVARRAYFMAMGEVGRGR